MNWHEAVVNAKPGDIAVARRSFIERWGKPAYESYIRRYAEALTPQYLVYAPKTKYLVWMYNFLAQRYAEHTGEVYQMPDEWVLPIEEDPLVPCASCGTLTSGFGDICGICWTIRESQAADADIARMNASVERQLKVTLAEK